METYSDICPCWHNIYSREVGAERRVTDPNCSACGGTGYAEFVRFHNPQNVVKKTT